jgi:TPR repeat protein
MQILKIGFINSMISLGLLSGLPLLVFAQGVDTSQAFATPPAIVAAAKFNSMGDAPAAASKTMPGCFEQQDLPTGGDEKLSLAIDNFYSTGEHGEFADAAQYFLAAANQGNPCAQYMLGLAYYYGKGVDGDYTLVRDWMLKSAEQHNTDAQQFLGFMYLHGEGVPKDESKAKQWFQQACEAGAAESCTAFKQLK